MKMLPYLALASVICLPLTAFAAPPTQAPLQALKAAPAPMQAPKAAQAPMQAPKAAQAPAQAPVKSAQAAGGYRTYSYEPAAAGYSYGGGYSSGVYRTRAGGHSYQNATNKTLGRVD
jgi:hypothetical protein